MSDDAPGDMFPASEFESPPGLRMLSRVGVGRRSQWFRAEQVSLGRMVALKFFRPFLSESAEFREVFLEAGRQASVIVHPAALPIINVFPAQRCIAMQWCPHSPLKTLAGGLSPFRAAKAGEVVLDCLSSLHATGRRHGNLSPGNVFLGDDDEVLVSDFFHPPIMVHGARMFMGDQRYIAPEALSGGAGDWRADLYSLGRVLSEALDRDRPAAELRLLLDSLCDADPAQRAGTPDAALDAFRRIRRLEEARAGAAGGSTRRRKRMYRRVPVDFTVSLRKRSATPVETATILMKTRDLGESGVFVETDEDLAVGSIIELDFMLKGVDDNVHAFGIVRWQSSPPMPTGVGVQFVEVDQSGLARLREYLGRRQQEDGE